MKHFLFFCSILLIGCKSENLKELDSSGSIFVRSFNIITQPIILIDSIELYYNKNLFDTNDVKKFHLLDALDSNDLRYPEKNLLGYHCTPVGFIKLKGVLALMYFTFKSEAGSGNPTIYLRIIDKNFKVLDCCELLSFYTPSDSYYPYNGKLSNRTSIIDSTHFFKVELFPEWYDSINDTLPQLKSLRQTKSYFQISSEGKIKCTGKSDSIIFENKNPIYYKRKK